MARWSSHLALAVSLWLIPAVSSAQDAQTAAATLRQGTAQYKALDFTAAKATFLKVDRDRLSDADKASLDEYLSKIDLAIRRQASAMSAYEAGAKALQANDWVKAKEQFEIAANSEYLHAAVRRDARAQLALVGKMVPGGAAPTPTTQPSPAVRLETPPTTMPAGQEPTQGLSSVLERRGKANALVAEGKAALVAGDAKTAAVKFEQALALVPEMDEARDLLKQAQALSAEPTGPLTVLEQRRRIKRQQTDVEFDKALKRSSELLLTASSAADFDAAAEAARLAENVIQVNRNLYTVGEHHDRLTEVAQRLDGIQARRADWEKAQVQKQLDQMAQAEAERARRAREQLDQQVGTLMDNARTLREEQKYKASLEVVQQILHLQPTHPWAADQEAVLRQFILLQEQKDVTDDRSEQEIRSLTAIRESAIPWYQEITFPRDWREKVQWLEGKGLQSSYGSEEDRRIRRVLKENSQPTVDVEEQPLVNVLETMQRVIGVNIWPNWKYLESAGYSREGTLVSSVHLVKVTNEKALQVILEDASGPNVGTPNELSFVVDGGVITVTTKQDLSRKVSQVVYDVRDIVRVMALAVRNLEDLTIQQGAVTGTTTGTGTTGTGTTGTTGTGTGTGVSISTGTGTTGTGTTTTEGGTTEGEPEEAADNIVSLITTTVDPMSWDFNGGEGRIFVYNDQIVVTQTTANHGAIADLISQLRAAKEIQVAIEARFISVSTGYLENIGVDLDFYFNIGSRLGSTSVIDPFTGASVPRTTGTSGWGTGPPGTDKITPLGVVQNSSTFTSTIASGLGSSIGSSITSPAMSLQGKFLDDIQVDFLIRATQAHQSTRTLTAPRLTLMSGTTATIQVGRWLWYVQTVTRGAPTVTSGGTVIPGQESATPAQLYLGSQLTIGATVSADLKYVTLRVLPSITGLLALTTFTTSLDPNTAQRLQLPDTTVQQVDTMVTVPDGGTLLLGGLKAFGEAEKEMGVPLLSKIPIINRAFTNRAKVQDDQTLLILIKPTIIVPRDEEKRLFP